MQAKKHLAKEMFFCSGHVGALGLEPRTTEV